MQTRVAYGDTGLWLDVPDNTTIVTPSHRPGVPDAPDALRQALRHPVAGPPLRERVHRGQTVAISACDITRPQPRHLMIPALLRELDGIVDLDDIVVLVATGTHRANTPAELRAMFGDEVVDSVRIVNHDSRAPDTMVWRGTFGRDVPVWLNREWTEADVRITTGFVEPHFFAGFSGGPKLVAPGLAALDTVLVLHDAARIGDPRATWGITHGNPVHDDIRAIAAATGDVTFALDVVLNTEQAIVRAFGGDLLPMHEAATAFAKGVAMQPVDRPFDVVVTTGSGYPLDQNLYQSVKGMSAAHQVVRPGGTIVCAAECRDGFPEHGSYREELTSGSPEQLLAGIAGRERTVPDQWQVQIQAKIQSTSRVVMHTSFLSDADLAAAHLEQTTDISGTVAEALGLAGPDARLCVLPEGPQTIPYVADKVS
jgi:nickel-dependent lactate racemase